MSMPRTLLQGNMPPNNHVMPGVMSSTRDALTSPQAVSPELSELRSTSDGAGTTCTPPPWRWTGGESPEGVSKPGPSCFAGVNYHPQALRRLLRHVHDAGSEGGD